MQHPHIGVSADRLHPAADNPREVAFANAWSEQQQRSKTLEHIIGKNYSDRDAEVAATVVQWLGSNVGMWFLADVINAEPHVKEMLERRVEWRPRE